MITFDSPRIQRFGSSASRRGNTVVDQATATSFCVPPKPPAGTAGPADPATPASPATPESSAKDHGSSAKQPGATTRTYAAWLQGLSDYEAELIAAGFEPGEAHRLAVATAPPAPGSTPAPAPGPAPAPVSSPSGPVENSGTMLATFLALGVVGGLFLWVTSGPQMTPRTNPEEPWWLKYLKRDVRSIIEKYDASGGMTEWKPSKSGGIVVTGISIAHNPRIMRELEHVAAENGMLIDKVPTHKDMEFGLTTLVFTPKSEYRFNPSDDGSSPKGAHAVARRMQLADDNFVDRVQEIIKVTRGQALQILKEYRAAKVVKRDLTNHRWTVVHSDFWEPDVLREALRRAERSGT